MQRDFYLNPDYDDYGDELDNPGDYDYSQFLANTVSNPDAAEAMSLAGDYRAEGYSPSQALKMGWQDVKGEEDNPTFEPSPLLVILGIGGAFTVAWRLIKKQWWWQSLGIGKRQLATVYRPRIARPQTNFGEVRHSSTELIHQARRAEEETVRLIMP
jgi:hypothetical protein